MIKCFIVVIAAYRWIFYLCICWSDIFTIKVQHWTFSPFVLSVGSSYCHNCLWAVLIFFFCWLAVPQDSDSFRQPDMHHGMEVRLGLSKGPICPSFNWGSECSSAARCAPQSSTSVDRPYYDGETWKLMACSCSVLCFNQHQIQYLSSWILTLNIMVFPQKIGRYY